MSENPNIYIENEPKKPNIWVRVAVITGMVVILFFIAVAIVKYVPKFISAISPANVSLTSLFSSKDKMSASVDPTQVASGNKFTISWKNNSGDTDGSTIWSFKCVTGITIEYNSINGMRPVVCDTLFPLSDSVNNYSFVAKNSTDAPIVVPMAVSFWDKDLKAMKFSGSTSLTVVPQGFTATPGTSYEPSLNAPVTDQTKTSTSTEAKTNTSNASTKTYTTGGPSYAYPTYTYTGPSDLAISLVSVGRITSNGSFEQTTSLYSGDRVSVKFNVSNVGSGRSGSWVLRTVLPTTIASERLFTSSVEPALNPGDSYQLTIAFDAYDPNLNVIQILVDTVETNQSNNSLVINVSLNGNYNNNNCYYNNGVYTCNNNNNCYYNNGYYNCNNNSGNRDLSVTITDVGTMDRNTGQFYNSGSVNRYDKAAFRFTVQNIGGTDTGIWTFNASLPSSTNSSYYSTSQNSLAPGQSATFTLGFENPYTGSNTVSVNIDPNNNISESNENNNYTSRSIYVNN
ncbi:MAG TPA: CARDB domain-containing protein [Candidatus Paceibacterota bacterium]